MASMASFKVASYFLVDDGRPVDAGADVFAAADVAARAGVPLPAA